MKSHPRFLLLVAVVLITIVPTVPLGVQPVRAVPGPGVDSPSNLWAPYGPFVNKLQLQFYSRETTELTNFEQGHIDVTDWALPPAKYASYDSNTDLLQSPTQSQFGDFGIFWNGASSTWAAWGCNWNSGPPSTPTPGQTTYTTACGINMRQAFMHLVDRPRFVTDSVLQGSAQALVDDSPPAKTPPASTLATQCSWDTMFPNCISAYNIAPDPGGFAAPGSLDFCAAADHMIAAGVASGKTAGTCVLTGINAGVFTHHIRSMFQTCDPRRVALGNGLMNAVNQLFGAIVVDPTYGSGPCGLIPFAIVFSGPPVGPLDDWDSYTYGYTFPGPFPDHLNDLFDSQHASDYCGGQQNGFPDNPTFVCIPQLDADSRAAVSTLDVPTFNVATLAAMNDTGKYAVTTPVFSPGIRIAALRSVAGLTNQRGFSYTNFWTFLFAHQDSGYTPANSAFAFGGGDPTTIRWGQASPTTELNVFQAQTVWEFDVIGQIYDTLFAGSPIQPANIFCWMCNTYQQSVDLSGNEHFLVELRQDIRWHDDIGGSAATPVNGAPIDAYDVAFSLLNLRDHAGNAGSGLRSQSFLSATVLSPTTLDLVFTGAALSNPFALESFVIPRHLWELAGDTTYNVGLGSVGSVDPAKSTIGFDPITAGAFVGSSVFACQSVFSADLGKVGTGCVKNADGSRGVQAIPIGGTMLLHVYDFTGQSGDVFNQFMRSYNTNWGTGSGTIAHSGLFQEFSWADRYDNAKVTIQDLASVAACFGKSSSSGCTDYSYWIRPAFHESTPLTISSEVTIVASHLDDTWVYPFSWSGDQSAQPGQSLENIIPFTQ